MGIATVAVYSDADRDALHVELADEAYCIGPASPSLSYLNVEKLHRRRAALGAEAIHPGYGFLAENAAFARGVVAGRSRLDRAAPRRDRRDGRQAARAPSDGRGRRAVRSRRHRRDRRRRGRTRRREDVRSPARAQGLRRRRRQGTEGRAHARRGRIRVRHAPGARPRPTSRTTRSTPSAISRIRSTSNCKSWPTSTATSSTSASATVRCSGAIRNSGKRRPRRSPTACAPAMREAGIARGRAIGYDSVGTIECLVAGDEFFFLEMNTRIQVEHTVTEMISGLDLIREQIRVAAGEPLGFAQDDIAFRGFAIEGRVNAEDPCAELPPRARARSARIANRADSACGSIRPPIPGCTISRRLRFDDRQVDRLGADRDAGIARLRRAIDEYVIEGVPTTLPLLRALCDSARSSMRLRHADARSVRRARGEPAARQQPFCPADAAAHVAASASGARDRRADAAPRRTEAPRSRRRHVVSPMHGVVVELPARRRRRPSPRVTSSRSSRR